MCEWPSEIRPHNCWTVDATGKIHRYTTTGTNQAGTKMYEYFLSVCGGLGMECPDTDSLSKADTDVTSCQTEGGDATPLGRLGKQKLRYGKLQIYW